MPVATVSEINSKAFLVDENGDKKELSLGDNLEANELIITASSDEVAALKLLLSNGKGLTLQGDDMLRLDSSVTQDSSFDTDESVVHSAVDLSALLSHELDLAMPDFASFYDIRVDEEVSANNTEELKLSTDDVLSVKDIMGEKDSASSEYSVSEHSHNMSTFIIEPEQV
ncbi:hypothetical protein [Campylobacter sp. 19-13652]|uniref:hypothetical protein n=1 Tax=Campylobacter sp. 19-13652 TaxID=2840180 RepID=UPI001C775FE0|nr:hypothetical protein [Campylobacter sp. 19-13652]BCX78860.1 hypothetical protein LBC_03220 [Campylobacter sp. 19-13652]